nr:MAG TPA: Guanylate kinase [Caudoviricetes sp.]
MIIFGYQGIGKSSLANSPTGALYIDLESSMFRTPMHPERSEDWFQAYGNIVCDLDKQGKFVFSACHQQIRDYIASEKNIKGVVAAICYPSLELREEWLYRLRQRWMDTQLPKDKAALDFAEASYSSSIKALDKDTDYDHIILNNMNYNLMNILISYYNYKYYEISNETEDAQSYFTNISNAGAILVRKGDHKK